MSDPIRDARIEYARVAIAKARMETALQLLTSAATEIAVTTSKDHDAARSVRFTAEQLRIAIAKLDLVIRRMPLT